MWQKIDKTTERLKVPFGWIVKAFVLARVGSSTFAAVSVGVSTTFVFDPLHLWKVDYKESEAKGGTGKTVDGEGSQASQSGVQQH